ncbi:MAG: hypothetical protein V3U62_10955 [Sedimenticolaceae bacterium]
MGLINSGLHSVVDTTLQHPEGRVVRVKGISWIWGISAQKESTAATELEPGNLSLGAFATQNNVVLAPIKLKSFSSKGQ